MTDDPTLGGILGPLPKKLDPPRCDCCDLPLYSCGRGAEQRQQTETAAERRRLLHQPGAIPARYPGICSRCNEGRFAEGDPIVLDVRPQSGRPGQWRSLLCCESPTTRVGEWGGD